MDDTPVRSDSVEHVVAEDADFPPVDAVTRDIDMSHVSMWMLGHAHIDLGYRWDLEETIHRICPWTFNGVLRMIDEHPGFVFAQSQMFIYDAMEHHYPRVFARIEEAIASGQWEVVGGAWCEYDTSLCSGESIVRQHLLGLRYAIEHLGVERMTIAFVPDSFICHPRTLPQILAGCGFRGYLFGRGLPQDPDHRERTRRGFRWRGPDGSELVAYLPFGPYSNGPMTKDHLKALSRYLPAAVTDDELALFGTGDHGGGPREPDFDALARLGSLPQAPDWRYGTLEAFFDTAFRPEVMQRLITHEATLQAFATGALTSQAQTKRDNRLLERALLESEALCAVATMLQRKPSFPRVDFQRLWRLLLTAQFHDILPGTSVASVYRDVAGWYEEIRSRLAEIDGDSVARIGSRIDTTCFEGYPVVVVNPSLRSVHRIVDIEIPDHLKSALSDDLTVCDQEGNPIEFALSGHSLRTLVRLEPFGYTTLEVRPATSEHLASSPDWFEFKTGIFESAQLRVEFSNETGDITCMVDRSTGTEVLRPQSNALELYREHELATSWVEVLAGAPVPLELTEAPHIAHADRFSATIASPCRTDSSSFTRSVTVFRHTRRVEAVLDIDWHEPGSFLKIAMTPAFAVETVRAAIPFGYDIIENPENEFLTHDWVYVEGADSGIAVLNDGSYGADVTENRLRMSVIRNVRDMDPAMSFGAHRLRYALTAHGSFEEPEIRGELAAFASPLRYVWAGRHPGGLKSWGAIDTSRPIPPRGSFVSIDNPAVEIEAFKMPDEAYTPEGFVIRLRELEGLSQTVTLSLPHPITRAEETDHLERPLTGDANLTIEGSRIRSSIDAYQIRTIIAYL